MEWAGSAPTQKNIIQNTEKPSSCGKTERGGLGNEAAASRRLVAGDPGGGGAGHTMLSLAQVLGCQPARGPKRTSRLLALCIPSLQLRSVPMPGSLESWWPEEGRSTLSKWPPGQEMMQSIQHPPPLAPETGDQLPESLRVPESPEASLRGGSLSPSKR